MTSFPPAPRTAPRCARSTGDRKPGSGWCWSVRPTGGGSTLRTGCPEVGKRGQRPAIAARSASSRSVYVNSKPASNNFAGTARCPARTPTRANSPRTTHSAGPGTGRTAGRCSTRPSAAVNSRLVTGTGADRLTGPLTGAVRRNRIASTSSCRLIHGWYWRPEPNRPPRPRRNSGSILASRPPCARTSPVRRWTTRTPASTAGAAAASHRTQTWARKSSPADARSSTTRSPVSPYQPTAEPASSTRGRSGSAATAAASALLMVVVVSTRLVRIRCLCFSDQRRSPTPTPARLITASTSASTAGSIRRCCGSHRCSSAVRGVRRTSRMTSCPSFRRAGTSRPPISPDAPVTAIFKRSSWETGDGGPPSGGPPRARGGGGAGGPCSGEPELALKLAAFQPLPDRRQEPRRVGAVDDPVIVGQRQVDHRPDRDDLAELRVLHDDRALHHRTDAQNGDLWLVDDRRVEEGTAAAGVGQREGPAAQLVRSDLVGPGPLSQVGDLAGQATQAEVTGLVDDRHEKPALGVHGDPEVLGVVVGDGAGVLVDRGVHRRMRLQCLDRGLGEEGQEGELDAFAGLEVLLGLLTQVRDPRDVRFHHGRQLRTDLQRLDHPPGDDRPEPRHLLRAASKRGVRHGGGGGRACRAGGSGGGGGRRSLLGHREDVLLPDPPADAGAGDGAQVDAAVGRQPADQGRDVAAAAVAARSLLRGSRLRGCRRGLCGGRRGRCGGRAGGRGLCLLRRGGDLGLGRRAGVVGLRGGGGRRRLGGRGGLLRRGRSRRPTGRTGADECQLRADVDGLVLVDRDLQQGSADR